MFASIINTLIISRKSQKEFDWFSTNLFAVIFAAASVTVFILTQNVFTPMKVVDS